MKKYLLGALVLACLVSILSISLIPRKLSREEVAAELERVLAEETVLEKNVSPSDWEAAAEPGSLAFGATVSRLGPPLRIYFDREKLRILNRPLTGGTAPQTP